MNTVPKVSRVAVRIEFEDGTVREYSAEQPAALDLDVSAAPFQQQPSDRARLDLRFTTSREHPLTAAVLSEEP